MTGALLQALISGLATGGIYALVALAFSITFTTTKTLNFGHGEFVSAGAFVGVSAMLMLLGKPMSGSLAGEPVGGWLQVIAIFVATFGIGLLGLLLYVLAVRPFAGKPGMSWVMTTLGFGIILQHHAGNAIKPAIVALHNRAESPFLTPCRVFDQFAIAKLGRVARPGQP